MVTSYVSDEVYDFVNTEEIKKYGISTLNINSKKIYDYPYIQPSDKVMPRSVYISENLSFSCDSSNCSKDIVNVTYENIYFNKNLDLKVAKIYNKDNYKKIFDKEYSDDNAYTRGKQKTKRVGIWYTCQSGIWQSVWLESTP